MLSCILRSDHARRQGLCARTGAPYLLDGRNIGGNEIRAQSPRGCLITGVSGVGIDENKAPYSFGVRRRKEHRRSGALSPRKERRAVSPNCVHHSTNVVLPCLYCWNCTSIQAARAAKSPWIERDETAKGGQT